MRLLHVFLLLVGAADAAAQCPGGGSEAVWYPDRDADSWGIDDGTEQVACEAPSPGIWAERDGDCNDDDPNVNPGATEICNDRFPVDDDCDGVADGPDATGQLVLYEDADGDGAGNPEVATSACSPPVGFVTNPDDCDDDDASAYAGAPERCNGLDDDCDGEIDEEPSATPSSSWYPDADGDGTGDASAEPVVSCSQPEGHVLDGRDCDDGDAEVWPGAEESCEPGAEDLNCDGFTGPEDADGDGLPACEDCDDGDADALAGADDTPYDGVVTDCTRPSDFDADEDGHVALAWGGDDCEDDDPAISPSTVEIPDDGIDQDCDGVDATSAAEGGCDGCRSGSTAPAPLLLLIVPLWWRRRR